MAESYSQLEVANSEHVHSSPEVVNYDSAPELASPLHDAPEAVEDGSHMPQRAGFHESPELDMKKWRPESPAPADPSTFSNPGLKLADADGNFAPQTKGAQLEKETAPRGGLGQKGLRSQPCSSVGANNSPASTPSPHGLLNDTSVAVVALDKGDKRLFFQESSGSIREALYTSSTGQWVADANNIVASDARKATPLAAFGVNSTGASGTLSTTIYIFYVTSDNRLASRQFLSGTWATRDNLSPSASGNMSIPVQTDYRALAVSNKGNGSAHGGLYVFYVASNGSAVCLSIDIGSDSISASPGPILPPSLNGGHILALAAGEASISRSQVGVLMSNGTVYYNLFFSFLEHGSWTQPQLQTILVPPLPAGQRVDTPSTLTLSDAYPAATTTAQQIPSATSDPSQQTAAYNESLIGDVDIAQVFVNTGSSDTYTLFGFWVNGTSLAAYTTDNIGLSTKPKTEFPFTRLAGTSNSSNIYLYHQMNDTAIAEDIYNTDGGFFTTDYMNTCPKVSS